MVWLKERMRTWCAVVVVLFVVAMIGPWTFDQIMVPAEYTCDPPFVRLEGDYCGMPMSGFWLAGWMGMGAVGETVGLLTGATPPDKWWRGPVIGLVFVLFLLPLFTTLILAWITHSRKWWAANLAAWGLAGAFVLYLSFTNASQNHPALWGLSVYRWLTIAVLISGLGMTTWQKWKGKKTTPGVS